MDMAYMPRYYTIGFQFLPAMLWRNFLMDTAEIRRWQRKVYGWLHRDAMWLNGFIISFANVSLLFVGLMSFDDVVPSSNYLIHAI